MYLNIIGLPAVLRDYVESSGLSLHLSAPHTSYRSDLGSHLSSPNVGKIATQRRVSPVGNLWCGVSQINPSFSPGFAEGGPRSAAEEVMMRMLVQQGQVLGTGVGGDSAFTLCGTAKDAKTLDFETQETGNRCTSYNVQVTGRKMVGTWTCSQLRQSGQITLHRTQRQPLPPSYFSRVNQHHIKFQGCAVVFTGTTQIGVVQAAVPLSAENSYFEVQVLDKGKECAIAVGVAHRNYPLDQMPG